MPKRKPVSVTVADQPDGRFVILTYANGDVVREPVDLRKRPTRKPRRPPGRLTGDRLNHTRQKVF